MMISGKDRHWNKRAESIIKEFSSKMELVGPKKKLRKTYVDMLNFPALYNAARMYPITAEPTTEPRSPANR